LHMDDLKLELMHRNVPENDIPESVTNRKNLLKDLEVERLKSDKDRPQAVRSAVGSGI